MDSLDSLEIGLKLQQRIKLYIYLSSLVEAMFAHEASDCKEHGEAGYCEVLEQLRLLIRRTLEKLKGAENEKRNSGELGSGTEEREV
jgi:hypothetical protein